MSAATLDPDPPVYTIGEMRVALALAEENSGTPRERAWYITQRAQAAGQSQPDGPVLIPRTAPKPLTRPGSS